MPALVTLNPHQIALAPPKAGMQLQKGLSKVSAYGTQLKQLSLALEGIAQLPLPPKATAQLKLASLAIKNSSSSFQASKVLNNSIDLYSDAKSAARWITSKRSKRWQPKSASLFSGFKVFKKVVKVLTGLEKMQLTPNVIAAKGISKSVKTACVIVALLISSHQLYQAVHKYWQGASVKKKPFSHLQVTEIRNRHALLLKMSGLSFEIISCIGQGVFPKHLSKRFKNANPSSVLLKFGKAIAE